MGTTADTTHEVESVEEIHEVNHRGHEVTRYKVVYRRSQAMEASLEADRLGDYAGERQLLRFDDTAMRGENRFMKFEKYHEVKRIIGSRLRLDERSYRVVLASTLLDDYLNDDRCGDLRAGYPDVGQLFVLFGYTVDTPNKILAKLVAQVVATRVCFRRHCWLFMPLELKEMGALWNDEGALEGLGPFTTRYALPAGVTLG